MSVFYNGSQFVLGKPQNGDLLFRWLPKGLPKNTKETTKLVKWYQRKGDHGQRQPIHQEIESAQHHIFKHKTDHLSNLQHVGIWHNDSIIEVGEKGIKKINYLDRSNYDVVLRSPMFFNQISDICSKLKLPIGQIYPLNDLYFLCRNPLETRGKIDQIFARLLVDEKEVAEQVASGKISDKHKPMQSVVCSHFVHAVLYAAAYPEGTVRVATMKKYDDYFKISPERLYRQYLNNEEGTVISKFRFIYVGLQHKGILIPYRALYIAGWRSNEIILTDWAKLNVIKIFHNELNNKHSMIEDTQTVEKIVTP